MIQTAYELSNHQRKYLPFLLAVALFMQILDATVLNTAIPKMAEALSASPLNMQWVVISYALTLAIFIPISGYLADRFGSRPIFLTALLLFSAGSLLCALSPNLSALIAARIVQGVGGAMMTPVARLVLIKSFPRSQLLTVMNYAVLPALIAPVLGPLVGGYIVQYFSWHWIFLINLPIGLLGIFFALKLIPNYHEKRVPFDGWGFVLFALATCTISLGVEFVSRSSERLLAILMMVLGGGLLLWYFHHAKRKKNALFPIRLFYVRTFRVGIMANLFTRLGISAIPFLLPLLLQIAHGYSPSQSGWMLAPMALGSIAIKPLVSKIIHHLGYRRTLLINTTTVGSLIAVLALLSSHNNGWVISPFLFIIGAANSLQFSAMNTITIGDLPRELTSSGNSLMAANQQLAIGIGIAFGAALLNVFIAIVGKAALTSAFQYTFLTLSIFTIIAGLSFRKLHRRDGEGMY